MPSIDIQVLEGVFSDEEKSEIIVKVTDAFAEVAGQRIKAGTSVRIHEIGSGAWGWGGEVLTTDIAIKMKESG